MTTAEISPTASLWQGGWYRFARHMRSPNQGPRPALVRLDLIVLHSISLPPGQFTGDAVQRLFTNQLDWNEHPYFKAMEGLRVSSHFFIRRDGELWQFVDCDERAWHAGVSHYRGRDNCNDDAIGVELEGLEGGAFEVTQYETLASLAAALMQRYPIAHIAGHEDVAPGRKSDPGSGFDWSELQKRLGCGKQLLPPRVWPLLTL
jgi:N-acetyl-anhydromuramoyl-L-alanine amidase